MNDTSIVRYSSSLEQKISMFQRFTLAETNKSPLKIGREPKGNESSSNSFINLFIPSFLHSFTKLPIYVHFQRFTNRPEAPTVKHTCQGEGSPEGDRSSRTLRRSASKVSQAGGFGIDDDLVTGGCERLFIRILYSNIYIYLHYTQKKVFSWLIYKLY